MPTNQQQVKTILRGIGKLSYREQKILNFRYGLFKVIPHTLEEIAKEEGLTKERIRQIEARAIERLSTYEPEHSL